MKPYDIFKKRKIRDKEDRKKWNRIMHKHCVVMVLNNKNKNSIVKDGEDNYIMICKHLGSDLMFIGPVKSGESIHNLNTKINKTPIKFKDKKLFKEFEDYLVAEAI